MPEQNERFPITLDVLADDRYGQGCPWCNERWHLGDIVEPIMIAIDDSPGPSGLERTRFTAEEVSGRPVLVLVLHGTCADTAPDDFERFQAMVASAAEYFVHHVEPRFN